MDSTNTSPTPGPGSPANPPPPQPAAAIAGTPDPVTAEILRKHESGAKLTSSEGGKLGAFKRKLKSALGVGPAERPEPNPFSPAAVRIPVAGVAPGQASPGGLPPVPVDPGIASRTALSLLNRCDAVTTRWITREARRAGVEGNTLADFSGKASLSGDDKRLMADLAPDICAELGIDPRKFPLFVAAGILGAHATSLALAVMELREMKEKEAKRERERNDRAKAVTVPATPQPGASLQPIPSVIA